MDISKTTEKCLKQSDHKLKVASVDHSNPIANNAIRKWNVCDN